MRVLVKIIAWGGAFAMMAGIFGLIAAMLVFSHYSKGLPSLEKLAQYEPPVVTRLYAANGKLLAEYATEKRIFVPLSAIPEQIRNAFIAAEDKHFYQHKGVDIYGIARAIRENIQNYGSGRSLVGGSTITQQVVKNFLLSNEKSFERKIREAILAYRISKIYSKDKILELYLNEIYLGNGSYGVAAAALNYFNKPLNELSVEEAALLAAMPKAPSAYDPRFNPERARERRNYVLGRMLDDGYISEFEAQRASMAPIVLEQRAKDEIVKADFFAEEVRRDLADRYGSDVLYEGGLTVKTTVDEGLQQVADAALRRALVAYDRRHGYRGPLMRLGSAQNWEVALPKATQGLEIPLYDGQQLAIVVSVEAKKAVIGLPSGEKGTLALSDMAWAREARPNKRRGPAIKAVGDVLNPGDIIIVQPLEDTEGGYGLHQIPEVNGALVAMEPYTGKVVAMSGGYSYINTEFNRATQARRQPGSAFKPLVYLAALENGYTPSTVIVDEPIEVSQGPGKPLWRPKNYGGRFLGPTTLRVGLEKSRNTMTVRLAQYLGLGRIINVAKRLGVYEGDVPRNYSMALGAHETTLLKMVGAYAMIANGGRRVEPALIERIDDRHGEIIYRRDDRACVGCRVSPNQPLGNASPPVIDDAREIVIDPRIAYQITSLMQGVTTRGTAAKARAIGKPVAGKTGTTNDSRDAWFIGFSPDLVVGVYVGYDQPKTLGARETGGRVALPGFIDFMTQALKDKPARPFRMPPGIRVVQVDRQTGLPPYPGAQQSGKIIGEVFVVGGSIYKPPLPIDAEEEEDIAALEYDVYQEIQDGFDPYADWEDVNHYMSPEQASFREQDYRRQQGYAPRYDAYGRPRGRPRPPAANGGLPWNSDGAPSVGYYPPEAASPPSPYAPPATRRQPRPEGYDIGAGRRPTVDEIYRPRDASRSGNDSVGYGTGGLY